MRNANVQPASVIFLFGYEITTNVNDRFAGILHLRAIVDVRCLHVIYTIATQMEIIFLVLMLN